MQSDCNLLIFESETLRAILECIIDQQIMAENNLPEW